MDIGPEDNIKASFAAETPHFCFFSGGGKRLRPRRQPKKIPLPAGRGEDENGRSVFTFFDLFSANLGYIKNLAGELLFIS